MRRGPPRGAVALDEVDARTMQSKRCPGLFVSGELLDIDGPIRLLAGWPSMRGAPDEHASRAEAGATPGHRQATGEPACRGTAAPEPAPCTPALAPSGQNDTVRIRGSSTVVRRS